MKFEFNNLTDSNGCTWLTDGEPQIKNGCLKLNGKSYLYSERTNISNFGYGEFNIEYKVKPALKSKGNIMMIYSSPLIDPQLGYSTFEVSINQYLQPAIQVTNSTTDLLRASGIDMSDDINLFDGKWHTIRCTRDKLGIIHWYHNGVEKGWSNTYEWPDINITSASASFIGSRYDIVDQNEYKFAGQLDYLEISKKI